MYLNSKFLKQECRKLNRVGKTIKYFIMAFNVQKFSYDGPGESVCYGRQDDHDHDKANQFTVDVTAYLQGQGCNNIVPGPFRSAQPQPNPGKEFRWNAATNTWVKA